MLRLLRFGCSYQAIADQIDVDGSITEAPGGGEVAGRSPVDRG
jgi:hypothetical protein